MNARFWLRAAAITAIAAFTATAAVAAPEGRCDCQDDDRDGRIDEGIDCLYDGALEATADDRYAVYLDGAYLGGDGDWVRTHTYGFAVPAGPHRLAVEAQDTGWAVQGFLARVTPPLAADFVTGDGVWQLRNTLPPAGWHVGGSAGFTPDDTALCNPYALSLWGGAPQSLGDADWVWAGGCDAQQAPRVNYAVADFEVCGAATVCCDLDAGGHAALTAAECADVGVQADADRCVEVCCQSGDDVATTTAADCEAERGRVIADALCDAVCCDVDDEYIDVSAFECAARGGRSAEQRLCDEACDCQDNDGDGAVDERVDCTYGAGLRISADDTYDAYLDGQPIGGDADWSVAEDYSFAVTAGEHVIAVEARDLSLNVQGLIARVFVPFEPAYDTGDGRWRLSNDAPAGDWRATGAGLPVDDADAICPYVGAWAGEPQSLSGADWVWATHCGAYTAPRTLFAATTFPACVEATVCCATRFGDRTLTAIECDAAGAVTAAARCEVQPCAPIHCGRSESPADFDGDGCAERCVPDRVEALAPRTPTRQR